MLNIFFLGLVSFFSDVSTYMVYPLIPLYLMATFGATPGLIGVIEGIAESLASLLKVFSGYISDRFQKKKSIAFIGYAAGALYKLALIFASTWPGILLARLVDRTGKGIRTAPRDVLISESINADNQGKAFGLHKAMDMLGAAVGILLTYFILNTIDAETTTSGEYKNLFMISVIPALMGLLMFFFIRQKKTQKQEKNREKFWKNLRKVDNQLRFYLFIVFLFTLGNSSNTFLLIKAKSVGFDDAQVILLYFLYNIIASLLAMPFGRLSDKIGRKSLLVPGYLCFSLCYLGFAFSADSKLLIVSFILYGIYTAMIIGVERAFVAELSPPQLKGTMLGLQSTLAGIALLPASVIAGLLWDSFGSAAPFLFGAILSFISAVLLIIFLRR